MANRTSEDEVKALLETNLDLEDLTPFVDAANMLVTANCTGVEYSDDELRIIETWLAAHLVCTRDPQVSAERIGDATWTYDGKTDTGLASTRYGQQLQLLDYKRTLASLDKSKTAVNIEVLG